MCNQIFLSSICFFLELNTSQKFVAVSYFLLFASRENFLNFKRYFFNACIYPRSLLSQLKILFLRSRIIFSGKCITASIYSDDTKNLCAEFEIHERKITKVELLVEKSSTHTTRTFPLHGSFLNLCVPLSAGFRLTFTYNGIWWTLAQY